MKISNKGKDNFSVILEDWDAEDEVFQKNANDSISMFATMLLDQWLNSIATGLWSQVQFNAKNTGKQQH